MKKKKITYQIHMFPAIWELFDKYVEVINWKLKERGLPKKLKGEILGAVLSEALLSHEREILEGHRAAQLGRIGRSLAKSGGLYPEISKSLGIGDGRGDGSSSTKK